MAHIITRLILGGAQENTLLTVEDQHFLHGDQVSLITGPGLGPEGSLLERAQKKGLEIHVVPELRRALHPFRDWSSYRSLVRLLKKIEPDVVHTHSSKAGILGRWAAAKLRIPAVHTIHGASFFAGQSWIANRIYRFLEWWAARSTAKLISVCDAMSEQYINARIAPADRFVTIYSGMEVESFLSPSRDPAQVRQELGIGQEEIVVAKIARLFHLKGHDDVIEAARMALARCPKLKFLFIGDGILRSNLQEKIRKLGISDRFHFTGLVPPEQVPELLSASDMVVHCSLREGLARVLPQGLLSGKPVISYDIDGAREVVTSGETGFLLPAGDLKGLSNSMIFLAENPNERNRMGTIGRDRCKKIFSHQEMTERIREEYQKVINDKRKHK